MASKKGWFVDYAPHKSVVRDEQLANSLLLAPSYVKKLTTVSLTSQMVSLLGALRRQRNGAVADGMCYYGERYGLNYGVSLPTVRAMAAERDGDHFLARFLYQQDIRELRLVALHIANPDIIINSEIDFWANGITTSEVAEEAAFALLRHMPHFDTIYREWMQIESTPLLQYAAMMAAARHASPSQEWLWVLEDALKGALYQDIESARLVVQGATPLLVTIAKLSDVAQAAVVNLVYSLAKHPIYDRLRDELSWRLGAE